MPSFLVHTLGCKVNQLESEAIIDAFLQAEFEQLIVSGDVDSPTIVIVNTCTVTSKADQKARRIIRKVLRDYPDSCVIVTGCYAKLDKEELLELEDNADRRLFVIDKNEILKLPRYINQDENPSARIKQFLLSNSRTPVLASPLTNVFEFNPQRFSNHTRSFLKIQDGCGNKCTYCKIRLARGQSVSLESELVLERLRILEKDKNEAVLAGVNISQYHDNTVKNLAGLLDYLLCGTEKIALRLPSLSPDVIDEALAKILTHKRIRAHFHLSIQSFSQKVLEKMGRSYNADTIEKACNLLRKVKDDPFLACDIITGFPGETEEEFDKTYSLCKKLDFAWIHVFPYSKRQGTPAYSFAETVQTGEKSRRVKKLAELAHNGKENYVRRWLGRDVDVLIETSNIRGEHETRYCLGTSENYLKTLVRYDGKEAPAAGSVLRCKLTEAGSFKDNDVHALVCRDF
ncbi:MAG: tRNA (N(6)-L-threonylcarbamoyladenosine(37)-C(2))-methylthiotransferase MtaB [Treponema sp.]|nr:tRNA (N(6)-L-threonylcarbamoyladenosine(37)-C(2))-methylthiotransferase MtaB [Treponema sp.]